MSHAPFERVNSMGRRLLGAVAVVAALVAVPVAEAGARTITVSGTVHGAAGYTVTASSSAGTGRSVRLTKRGRFALKVNGAQASLTLIRPNGTYYGPIVLDRVKGGRVHQVVKRSAKLGDVRLAGGYAVLRKPLGRHALAAAWARADRRGKPVGAGRLGARVRTAGGHSRAATAADAGSRRRLRPGRRDQRL
jgi:hypothetical protein